MKKIYYLQTCDTCKKIMKSIALKDFEFQEIKTQSITNQQLEEMRELSGSYESLFSRRAKKYAAMGLKNEVLTEVDFKQLILSDYTFLKRPVIIFNNQIFIGSDKKNLAQIKESIK